MPDGAGEVVAEGIGAKKTIIDGEDDPGERVPIGRPSGGERPDDAGPIQSVLDGRILGDVIAVVIIDEAQAEDAGINDGDGDGQAKADQPFARRV